MSFVRLIVFKALALTDSVKPLFERQYFRDNYLQYANQPYTSKGEVKVKNNNSMLTYTTYVGNFVSYIKAEKLYDVIDVSLEDVDAFIVQLGKMRSNYRKEKSRDDRIREELEGDKIRTYLKSSTVSDYMQSESAAEAHKLFLKYKSTPSINVTRQEYCLMRDYLIFMIELRVAHRDGVLLNMTLKEFNTGVWTNGDDNNGQFQVRVAHHKTASTKGVARVCLTEELYSDLTIFARQVRPYIAQAEMSSYLFTQWKPVVNDPMQSGSTSKKVTKLLHDINAIPRNVSVCCNDLRKNMSTQMIEKYGKDSTRVIAGAMAHKESTAEQYYRRHNLMKEAHEAQNMMSSYWENDENANVKHGYHIWDGQDVVLLQEHFSPEERRLTRSKFMMEYEIIKDKMINPGSPEKTYNKVRKLFSPKKIKPDSSLPSLPDSSLTNPSLPKEHSNIVSILPFHLRSQRLKRESLSIEEENLLYQKCKHMLIPDDRVKMGCSVIADLVAETGLLSKYTPMQLRTRVEYWRKKEESMLNVKEK